MSLEVLLMPGLGGFTNKSVFTKTRKEKRRRKRWSRDR